MEEEQEEGSVLEAMPSETKHNLHSAKREGSDLREKFLKYTASIRSVFSPLSSLRQSHTEQSSSNNTGIVFPFGLNRRRRRSSASSSRNSSVSIRPGSLLSQEHEQSSVINGSSPCDSNAKDPLLIRSESLRRSSSASAYGSIAYTSPAFIINSFDCVYRLCYKLRGELVQGVLYVCAGFMLFNGRRHGILQTRIQIDWPILMAIEKNDDMNGVWLAMVTGSVTFANFRHRDRAFDCIQCTWARSLQTPQTVANTTDKVLLKNSRLSLGSIASPNSNSNSKANLTTMTTTALDVLDAGSIVTGKWPCECRVHYRYVLVDRHYPCLCPRELQESIFPPFYTQTPANNDDNQDSIEVTLTQQWLPKRPGGLPEIEHQEWSLQMIRRHPDAIVVEAQKANLRRRWCFYTDQPWCSHLHVTSADPSDKLNDQDRAGLLEPQVPLSERPEEPWTLLQLAQFVAVLFCMHFRWRHALVFVISVLSLLAVLWVARGMIGYGMSMLWPDPQVRRQRRIQNRQVDLHRHFRDLYDRLR